MVRKFLLVVLIGFSTLSSAGNVSNTTVSRVYCQYHNDGGMCSVFFAAPLSASCQTIAANRLQFELNDEYGKGLLSIALTAYASKAKVNATGKNTCLIYPGLDDLKLIELI